MHDALLYQNDKFYPLYKRKNYESLYFPTVEPRHLEDKVDYNLTITQQFYVDITLQILQMSHRLEYEVSVFGETIIHTAQDLIIRVIKASPKKYKNISMEPLNIVRLAFFTVGNLLYKSRLPFRIQLKPNRQMANLNELEHELVSEVLSSYAMFLTQGIFYEYRNNIVASTIDELLDVFQDIIAEDQLSEGVDPYSNIDYKDKNLIYQCLLDACTSNLGEIKET